MALLPCLTLCLALRVAGAAAAAADPYALPEGLLIGAGVSAFQTEGSWDAEGKSESAVDHVLHSGKLSTFSDPHQHDVAANSYTRYKEDVKAAADLGLKLFRFSISWSRILPDAVKRNEPGIKHYHDLIDEILKYNMTPMVTLYHFDHPWILEDQFHGWQSEKIVPFFKEYAKVAFEEYGKKVQLWTTINEPKMVCAYFPNLFVTAGMYQPEDADFYRCMRNTILAHAEAYHAFKEGGYDGQVGSGLLLMPARPNSTLPEDAYAADVFNQISGGLLLSPIVYGDYPQVVKKLTVGKLQPFSEAEKARIKATTDFIGFNVYISMVAGYTNDTDNQWTHVPGMGPLMQDMSFVNVMVAGGNPQHTEPMFSLINPDALRSAMVWTWNEYKLPLIITENGFSDGLGKQDHLRGVYYSEFLRTLISTMKEYSIKVMGYCAWSLIDAYEWSAGFDRPFGLVHVDYAGGSLNRSLKDSSQFWIEMARTKSVPLWERESPSSAASVTPAALVLLLALAASMTGAL